MSPISLRHATKEDVLVIYRMLMESAVSQNGAGEVCANPENLLEDGFSSTPRFQCLVAECDGEPAGIAVYFSIYSTWTSRKGCYLEDLYVAPQFRRRGVAHALMTELSGIARDSGCGYMRWLVLRDNHSAIRFYESIGARIAGETALMTLTLPADDAIVSGPPANP
ncbi:MAG TPA: GNAT family N-acetyltransferase [Candidatus Angelobacter sp.]|nr:GNAT family N-acetyltransferase [Candidatus Angelobacter sp.]